MFGKRDLLEKIADLEERNKNLQDRKEEKREKQRSAMFADIDACKFVWDWKANRTFSLERDVREERGDFYACTVIGYLKKDSDGVDSIGQWIYVCSTEEHNRLAEEFANFLGRGSKQTKSKPTLLTESKPTSKVKK